MISLQLRLSPKTTALALLLLSVSLSVWGSSIASAHQCRYLKPDERNLCLAQKENARFYCGYIKDPDQQRYCLAFLDRAPNVCAEIANEALKAQCTAEAEARLAEQQAADAAAKAAAEASGASSAGASQSTPSAKRTP